jgi:hypothetical protein
MKFYETHQPKTTAYLSSAPIQAAGNLDRHFVTVPISSTIDLDQIRAAYAEKIQSEEYGEFLCSLTVFRSENERAIRPGFSFDFRVYAWGEGEEEEEEEDE